MEKVSVLAASATQALRNLSVGFDSPEVVRGLEDGLKFCDILAEGPVRSDVRGFATQPRDVRETQRSVFEIEQLKDLAKQAPSVRDKLAQLKHDFANQLPVRAEEWEELRQYFYQFAVNLPIYEAARTRFGAQHAHV